jgi:prepilin-type N-terminal cleavage/methylation domain-containing protein
MNTSFHVRSRTVSGFTIVELLIVIVVIGILATLAIVGYNGVQQTARDRSVQSDINGIASEVTRYGTKNQGVYGPGVVWYSPSGANVNIVFTPSSGNVIDVAANSKDYCIRGYNPAGTKKSIDTGYTKESSPGACTALAASTQSITDSDAVAANEFKWKSLADSGVGANNMCATGINDLTYCWGYNAFSQVGDRTTTDRSKPTTVNTTDILGGNKLTQISSGSVHTCAIATDQNAYCWGNNTSGVLGDGTTVDRPSPVQVVRTGVLSGKTIKSISAGDSHTCVIASDDNAYCWGANVNGGLGNGATVASSVPVAVTTSGALSGKTIKSISSGYDFTCAIASDNNAYCWGTNNTGQLGINSTTRSLNPVAVLTSGALIGKTVTSLSANYNHTCTVASDNNAYCWGANASGEIGDGTTVTRTVPTAVTRTGVLNGKTIKSISSGFQYNCVIASDDYPYCWGQNFGRLGNGSNTSSTVPVATTLSGALNGKKIASITAADTTTCALTDDSLLYCWGSNYYGMVGNSYSPLGNFSGDTNVPVKVSRP